MEEMRSIIRAHALRYPLMQPTDAVKLIYQNEFGGGHMIKDEAACLRYLHAEYGAIAKNPGAPRSESIGNGIERAFLAPLMEEELDALGRAFIRSASAHTGSLDRFRQKLEVLRDLTAQGIFAFTARDLDAYLTDYAAQGYPPVSHSQVYRDAYAPAYRVVCAE